MTLATTPFGAAPLRAPMFNLQKRLARLREAPETADNAAAPVDKWKVVRALSEARAAFGLSDRAVAVLEALAGFRPGREIDAREPAIVFPSNAELSLRTGGMAEATLRRHIAALVAAGLVVRRDSPNGKRYCRRDETGAVDAAFGFDLAPLVLMAAEIFEAADEARKAQAELRRLREQVSLRRRDIAKILAAAYEEGRAGDWEGFAERLRLAGYCGRGAIAQALTACADALTRLQAEVEIAYLATLTDEEMSGNDADSERHLQNSNSESNFENSFEKKLKPQAADQQYEASEDGRHVLTGRGANIAAETKTGEPRLQTVMKACPQFALYARDGIRDWPSALATAGLVRSMLGISRDAWDKACEAMGDRQAVATIAAILERAEAIRSPGGYLRALTARAEAGKFSARPMLEALTRTP